MAVADASGTHYWVLRTREHWLRCDHVATALDADHDVVTLAPNPLDRTPTLPVGDPAQYRHGAAWDACERLWRSIPLRAGANGWVERVTEEAHVKLGEGMLPVEGCAPSGMGLIDPRGIAIDGADRLYIADAGLRRVVIVDLATGRQVARQMPPSVAGRTPMPWDFFADPTGRGAYLLDRGTRAVWRMLPDRAPMQILGPGGAFERPGEESLRDPVALAATTCGDIVVLDRNPSGSDVRLIWARHRDIRWIQLGANPSDSLIFDATTFALDDDGHLIVGGDPLSTLVRYRIEGTEHDALALELHEIGEWKGWGFDGGAVVVDPEADVLFTTLDGVAAPAPAFPNYATQGHVVSFALDSSRVGCVWHRLFLELCLPDRTQVTVFTRTSDTLDPPVGVEPPVGGFPIRPPQGFGPGDVRVVDGAPTYDAAAGDWTPMPGLLRRPGGADRPFYKPDYPDELPLDLYEGLVFSPPGRYLWIHLRLEGTDRTTPHVRGLRAYYPRPSYLRYLPETYREDDQAARFLDRMLAMFELFHSEVDAVRDAMPILYRADAVPSDALDWLAGWLGMVLDPRWPEAKRRELLGRAAALYRDRGTVQGLTDFLGIYLDVQFTIVEGFRTRQSGGFVVGGEQTIVGPSLLVNDPEALADDTAAHAHRFSVFIGGELEASELEVVKDIVELEKPAHTLADICDVTDAFLIGTRALVGISTRIGRSRCFRPAVLDDGQGWPLGREAIIGGDPRFGGDATNAEVGTFNLGRNTVLR